MNGKFYVWYYDIHYSYDVLNTGLNLVRYSYGIHILLTI